MTNLTKKGGDQLFVRIASLIEDARKKVATTVNLAMVYTYFEIGRMIVEDEQHGAKRASYGKTLLKDLSLKLTERFGKGYSVENLSNMRLFYRVYSKSSTLSTKSRDEAGFTLGWSHYLLLMRLEDSDARSFYEIEAAQEQWSVRTLSRQIGSSLYERLALSRDKDKVMQLSQKGHVVKNSEDIIKDPLVLEFLGLESQSAYTESALETAIIDKMQNFLLELGKGFLFEARQKRFSFNEQHFFVDLVFYNRLLQCYVLIDLKTGKLTHQDLGQMQMYVNYFDRHVKLEFEKPTVGILLCEEKNDLLVKLTLPEKANIYASEYKLYLPNKSLLQKKLREWKSEFEEHDGATR